MARLFDDAQNEYLKGSAVLTAPPLAMACCFNSDDATIHQFLLGIADESGDEECHLIEIIFSSGVFNVYAVSRHLSADGNAITASTVSKDVWNHACGIFVSATDRRVLVNGGSKGTDSTSIVPVNIDVTSIALRLRASPILPFSGRIAEAAIWDLSAWPGATDSDKADNFEKIVGSLAKGFSPLHFPLGLKAYWPLIRSTDNDVVGGYNMTPYNTPSIGTHCPTIYPTGPQFSHFDFTGFTGSAFHLALTLHEPTIVIPTDVTIFPETLRLALTQHSPEIDTSFAEIPPFMQKDLIDPYSGGAWLWLCEIAVPGYDNQDLARNTVDVRFVNKDYKKWNFDIGKQTFAGDGSIPRVVLRVGQDPDHVIEDIVNDSEGCHDGTVKLIRVNEKFLDYEVEALEVNYGVLVADSDAEWIYFTLGIPNPLTQRIPLRIGSSKICPWPIPSLFKGPRCQYTGDDPTCTGMLDDCYTKGNAHHWGAELGLDPNVTRV